MTIWSKGIMAALLTGVVSLGSLPALAEPYQGNVDRRQIHQERRIQQGVQSGQVSPREFQRLEHQQARINHAEARMRADGRLNRQERTRIHQMQNRASQNINRSRHNPGWQPNRQQAHYRPGNFGPGNFGPRQYQAANSRPGWR